MKIVITGFVALAACSLLLFGCIKNQTPITQDNAVKLTVTDTAGLKADGTHVITLTAQIPANAADAFKNVTFNLGTGLGTFVGSAATGSSVVTADVKGTAVIAFKVGLLPGKYFVSAQVGTGATLQKTPDIPVVVNALAYSDKIVLTPSTLLPVADGLSLVTFTLATKYETEKSVAVTTNQGSLIGAASPLQLSVPLDDKGNGSFTLMMGNEVLPYAVTAAFTDKVSATVALSPQVSRPDTLIAEPSALKVDTVGTAVTITTRLIKNQLNAKVSKNTQVYFSAYQLTGTTRTNVGRFTGTGVAVSDATGTVPVVSFFGDTGGIDKNKIIFIEVSAFKTATSKTVQTLQLNVKK
jgi:hypothetical protein